MLIGIKCETKFKNMERVSKKTKLDDSKQLFARLVQEYPDSEFKLSSYGNVTRKIPSGWTVVCEHNRTKTVCRECGNGKAFCEHGKRKTACPEVECGGGGALCQHNKLRTICTDSNCGGGGGLCEHNKPRTACKEQACGGGGAYCKHGRARSRCKEEECGGGGGLCEHDKPRGRCVEEECGGGGQMCSHGIRRSYCREEECGGGSEYCTHGKLKSKCTEGCGNMSGLCVACLTRHKQKEGYCLTCHPDYVPAIIGASKAACKYICALQKRLGKGTSIQHVHYGNGITGNEYVLPEYPLKKVDGYYVDDQGRRIVVEFLGNIFHGHPSFWKDDEQKRDMYNRLHKDNFYRTERIFNKVASFGYIVRYVWESDYKKLKALQSPLSILREFDGKLKY